MKYVLWAVALSSFLGSTIIAKDKVPTFYLKNNSGKEIRVKLYKKGDDTSFLNTTINAGEPFRELDESMKSLTKIKIYYCASNKCSLDEGVINKAGNQLGNLFGSDNTPKVAEFNLTYILPIATPTYYLKFDIQNGVPSLEAQKGRLWHTTDEWHYSLMNNIKDKDIKPAGK